MIKIEKDYTATAFFSEDKSSTWDSKRNKIFKLSIFGLTIFKRNETLDIDYGQMTAKKLGFK